MYSHVCNNLNTEYQVEGIRDKDTYTKFYPFIQESPVIEFA